MSPPSAPFSKRRPDHGYGDRALRILGEHLKACGQSDDVRSLLATAPAEEVRLPGFDLFTRGARSPYEWCVPRPRDEEQLLNTYEEYVDRDLGRIKSPERVAKQLYTDRRVARQYFGAAPRHARYWYTPAAKIIAAAQHFDVVVSRSRNYGLSTNLLGYELRVSPTGCHSNVRRASIAAPLAAVDCTDHELSVTSLRIKHPLASALATVGADDACLWAANSAIRAEMDGMVDVKDLFTNKVKRALSAAEKRRRTDLVMGAAMEATEVAQNAHSPVTALYEALVPAVCTAVRFKALFGHPWAHPGRAPRPETRAAWLQRIDQLSAEALNELA